MIKKLLFIFLLVGICLCVSASPVQAQSANCTAPWYCSWYSFSSGCVPAPPQGAYGWQNIGPWAFVVSYLTTACAPPPPPCTCCCAGGGAGGPGGAGPGGSRSKGGKPIMLDNGDTSIEQTDVRIPGLSGGLTLVRTWNSLWPIQILSRTGLFGPNWRSTYEERVFVGPDNYIKYSQRDGGLWSFAYAGSAYAPVSPG